jgi:hypothetical protein
MIAQAPTPFGDQNVLVAILLWGYVKWQLQFFGRQKEGGACTIIFAKNPLKAIFGDQKISVAIR